MDARSQDEVAVDDLEADEVVAVVEVAGSGRLLDGEEICLELLLVTEEDCDAEVVVEVVGVVCQDVAVVEVIVARLFVEGVANPDADGDAYWLDDGPLGLEVEDVDKAWE